MNIIRRVKNALFPIAPSPPGELLWDKPFHSSPVIRWVEAALSREEAVALVYLDLVHFRQVEQEWGPGVAAEIIASVEAALQSISVAAASGGQIGLQNLWGDDFIVYLSFPTPPGPEVLEALAGSVLTEVQMRIRSQVPASASIRFHTAHTMIQDGHGSPSSRIYQAVQRAMQTAKGSLHREAEARLQEFDNLIAQQHLYTVYQPIVSLISAQVLGWEALIRGPAQSGFQTPDALFQFAEETNRMWTLERACRQAALRDLPRLAPDHKLFLNVNPQSINDPHFIHGETLALIQKRQLQPQNVVFEITERNSIKNFSTFRRALQHYRSQGYLVAVDDLGAGYSSLQSIAELRPDFIKLDMSLIKGIHTSTVRQTIVETFVAFAAKTGCLLIAEGAETREELQSLARLGVQFAQGYYLARPGTPLPVPAEPVREFILRLSREPRRQPALNIPVTGLLEPGRTVPPETPVREVAELFKADERREGVVITEENRPVGIVERDHLLRQLATPFGVALYYERPVSGVMDRAFLCVESDASVEQVARQVLSRDVSHRYDPVVAMEGGQFRGILSAHRFLLFLADVRLTMAHHANPLTGMPGNPAIYDEIANRLRSGQRFSVVYLDLNFFKDYNDAYGFACGDQALLFTARLTTRIATRYGGHNPFIGHVGGDDFVIVLEPIHSDDVCRRLIKLFDRVAPRFHSAEERKAGKMMGQDRLGGRIELPLLSVAVAAVSVAPAEYDSPEAIARASARAKRQAKAHLGSHYVNLGENAER